MFNVFITFCLFIVYVGVCMKWHRYRGTSCRKSVLTAVWDLWVKLRSSGLAAKFLCPLSHLASLIISFCTLWYSKSYMVRFLMKWKAFIYLFFSFVGIYMSQMWIRLYWGSDRWFQVLYKLTSKPNILVSKLFSPSIVWVDGKEFLL